MAPQRMLVDTHCHIDGDRFDEDRQAVLARARAAGVTAMINVGCDLPSSRRSLDLARYASSLDGVIGLAFYRPVPNPDGQPDR